MIKIHERLRFQSSGICNHFCGLIFVGVLIGEKSKTILVNKLEGKTHLGDTHVVERVIIQRVGEDADWTYLTPESIP